MHHMQGEIVNGIQKNKGRDLEKDYPSRQFVATLRRLADCLEQGKHFRIQVVGERILIPHTADVSIEHERNESGEEIEFLLKWPQQEQPLKIAGKKPRNLEP